ncbi:MAG TPA: OsmC family protein [Burkholderiaceae bacterium]|nr:OsmC family protein [Burkholderiaceae bacterium]
MSSPSELLIARCTAVAAETDPNYRQSLRCGHHSMLADERPARGGADAGPMPFEYLLSALGSCTSITLRMYAERKAWPLGTVTADLAVYRSEDSFRIERNITMSGALTAEQRAKLAEICEKTPVTLALKAGTGIATTLGAAAR